MRIGTTGQRSGCGSARPPEAVWFPLIEEGKVFVNGRLVTSNGCQLKEDDLISVRGNGRFPLSGTRAASQRKGRCVIEIERVSIKRRDDYE